MATVIRTATDLQNMENALTASYELGCDINAFETLTWDGGLGFDPIGKYDALHPEYAFTGYFDGKGYKISNLFINRTEFLGLFGYTGICGSDHWIKNVGLTNVDITGRDWIGGLVGFHQNGAHTISNCYVTGNIVGQSYGIGGLLGYNGSIVEDCHSDVDIVVTATAATGDVAEIGGFIGEESGLGITRCYATGDITINGVAGEDVDLVGGFAGDIRNKLVSRCYATGNVIVSNAVGRHTRYIGGFAGSNGGYEGPSNCYARGNVTVTKGVGATQSWVGGFAGMNSASPLPLLNCYSTGTVSASGMSYVGGFCGQNTSVITSCFWDTQTSGQATSSGGTGKTTAEMKDIETFQEAGWSMSRIWNVTACNNSYPCLIGVTPCCASIVSPADWTIAEPKVTLEAIRNIEMVYGGRFYIDKSGNAVYESRYHRNV